MHHVNVKEMYVIKMTSDFEKNMMNPGAEIKQYLVLTVPTASFSGFGFAGRTQDL